MSAAVGAGALITMGTCTAVPGMTQAIAGAVVPEHFGGPVNTSIDDPPVDLGIPTSSPSNAPPSATADFRAPKGVSQRVRPPFGGGILTRATR
ncbi:MAG: hypothetical protein QOG79_2525 [Mycobacterium sp.]|jgi:hypothetical protein|nr:hypothetical protein [Mycobacterium sp.]